MLKWISQEACNYNFQRLNEAYRRVLENLEHVNMDHQDFPRRNTHRRSNISYEYDPSTDTWSDTWGNKFQYRKVAHDTELRHEERELIRRAFSYLVAGLVMINLFSVIYFIQSYKSGCRCARCSRYSMSD